MANRRFSQRLIDTLKPGKSVREVRDTELRGFGVRILPSGRKRYFVHAQCNGKRTWTKLGDTRATPPADARDVARSHLSTSRTGDPSPLRRSLQGRRSRTSLTPSSAGSPGTGRPALLRSIAVISRITSFPGPGDD